ncbi:DUF1815 family protein [Synechococcus sp. PCC 7336]|uniref:DUF1815 family protein n=1 Tax=Synechococcus sp. PCC 7336 TaxID=195250 RepID=UPI0003457068|nr:DUF1815 family protein [Synechococcus sp. PCC 7336]
MFNRLAQQHRQFNRDLIMSLQALAIVLERRGYMASCYTSGDDCESASFMVSEQEGHLVRVLVSECATTWTEMQGDREIVKLEGGAAIEQLQELVDLLKELTIAAKPEIVEV